MDTKFDMSQQQDLIAKKAKGIPDYTQVNYHWQVEKGDLSPLLRTGEATPAVQCQDLGSPVLEKLQHTGQNSAQGQEDD